LLVRNPWAYVKKLLRLNFNPRKPKPLLTYKVSNSAFHYDWHDCSVSENVQLLVHGLDEYERRPCSPKSVAEPIQVEQTTQEEEQELQSMRQHFASLDDTELDFSDDE
jgi:hypothetical protein